MQDKAGILSPFANPDHSVKPTLNKTDIKSN